MIFKYITHSIQHRANKIIQLTICILFILLGNVYSQFNNSIIIDKNLSPYAGSENSLFINNFLFQFEEQCLKPKFNSEPNISSKAMGIGYRSLKTLVIDYPTAGLLWIIQHEYFGHGYKARELNFNHIDYEIAWPFPYGKGNGYTKLDQGLNRLTSHEKSAIYYSGSQATSIVTNALRRKFIKNRSINYKEAILYLISYSDLTKYILSTDLNTAENSNDMVNYLMVTYDEESSEDKLNQLKKHVLVNFISPFPYLSLFTFFKTYLWDGNSQNTVPMIPLGGFDYLPSFRLGLSPFGYEIYSEHYVRTSRNIVNFYLRYGEPEINKNWGLGVYVSDIFKTSCLLLDGEVHFWKQPVLILSNHNSSTNYGGSALITAYLSLFKNKNFNLLTQVGYKSKGFFEGENLSNDFIFRIGFSFLD